MSNVTCHHATDAEVQMMGRSFIPSKILHSNPTVPRVQRRLACPQVCIMHGDRCNVVEALLAKICLNFTLEFSDPLY